VGDVRVFYDLVEDPEPTLEVLAIVLRVGRGVPLDEV
jgi:hypothetical protein